jgi:hypothetical protein
MKKWLLTGLFCAVAALGHAQSTDTGGQAGASLTLEKVMGKVVRVGETWLIETQQHGSLQRYIPDGSGAGSDTGWQVEGLEVVISGQARPNPPHVRAMGSPLQLSSWTRLYRAQPGNDPE